MDFVETNLFLFLNNKIISHVTPYLTGYVSCSFTDGKSEPISEMAYLDVLLKPQIDVNPLSVRLEEGQDTTLNCSISIPTTPKDSSFQWIRWHNKVVHTKSK